MSGKGKIFDKGRSIVPVAPLVGGNDQLTVLRIETPRGRAIEGGEGGGHVESMRVVKLIFLGKVKFFCRRQDSVAFLIDQDIDLINGVEDDDAEPDERAHGAHVALDLVLLHVHLDAEALPKLVLALEPGRG